MPDPGPGRHPLHRLHRQRSGICGARWPEPALLPGLSAPGGGDRRQGLRHRASLRRHRRAADGADPGRVRVSGPEVLGRLPRLCPAVGMVADARRPRQRGDALPMGDVSDFCNFMGAVIDDRSFARLSGVIDRVRGENGVDIAGRWSGRRQRGVLRAADGGAGRQP